MNIAIIIHNTSPYLMIVGSNIPYYSNEEVIIITLLYYVPGAIVAMIAQL